MRFSYKEEYTQKKLIKWYLLQLKWEKQIVWNILEGEKSMGNIMLDYDYNIIIHLMKKNLIAETIYFLWILCILWSIKEKECYLFIRLQNDRIFISHPSNPIYIQRSAQIPLKIAFPYKLAAYMSTPPHQMENCCSAQWVQKHKHSFHLTHRRTYKNLMNRPIFPFFSNRLYIYTPTTTTN